MNDSYQVELTAKARSDLLAARIWLTQPGSGLRARLRLARISRALVELEFTPFRWPLSRHSGTRQRIVDTYTITYHVDDSRHRVTILRVFAPYQDRAEP